MEGTIRLIVISNVPGATGVNDRMTRAEKALKLPFVEVRTLVAEFKCAQDEAKEIAETFRAKNGGRVEVEWFGSVKL